MQIRLRQKARVRLGAGSWVVSWLGLALALVSSPAWGSQTDESSLHLGRGAQHYQAGRYDEAVVELKLAYDLNPLPRILCNLAQAYRRGGHPQEALDNYQLCLHTDPKLSAAERTEFQGYVDALQKELAPPPTPVEPAAPPPPPPPPPPVYKRAWFWGVIGGVVAATAIGVGLGVGLSRSASGPQVPDGVPVFVF